MGSAPHTNREDARAWGLFRLPAELGPGELKEIQWALTLPRTYRGFVSEHATRDEAFDAWEPGLFVREIDL